MIPKFKKGDFIRDISGFSYLIAEVKINKIGDNYYILEWVQIGALGELYTACQTFICDYIENNCYLDVNHAFYKAIKDLK